MPERYVRTTTRNRSLTRAGQRLFLIALTASVAGFAVYAALHGAWLVLPFAGLEIGIVFAAFYVIRAHDDDYESIEIEAASGCLEVREAGRVRRLEFNPEWAQVVCKRSRWRCDLALRTHGRQVRIGCLMSDEERADWAAELTNRVRVVRG